MRLIEAVVDANHRAIAGDRSAGLRPADYADSLPIIALTCIDPRLNPLMPAVLGIPEEHFIWLRNAGNIIFDPMSSMTRTLALACAIKGGREIALIGHTDCRVGKTSVADLIGRFQALGVERARLPDNLNEFFGLFASERQNVIRGVDIVRSSPLIGPKVPVHGLLVDIANGKLEWLVNGYQAFVSSGTATTAGLSAIEPLAAGASSLAAFHMGEMKFPESKIGEGALSPHEWKQPVPSVETSAPEPPKKLRLRSEEPPLSIPPPIRSAAKPVRPVRSFKK
jgi:carbonic anhydrase